MHILPYTIPLMIKLLDDRLAEGGEFGLPKPGTIGAAGTDLFACATYEEDPKGKLIADSRKVIETGAPVAVMPNKAVYVGLGFAMATEEPGWGAMLMPRSGTGSRGLVLGNLIGLIDIADYRGEVIARVWNRTDGPMHFTGGERICQMVLGRMPQPEWTVVDELPASVRGTGGFGSTGHSK